MTSHNIPPSHHDAAPSSTHRFSRGWAWALAGVAIVAVLVGAVALSMTPASAAPSQPSPAQQTPSNQTCFACHATPGMQTTLASGEALYLTVDPQVYNDSVHGKMGYACVQCHTNITGYPHPPLTARSHRELTLALYRSCQACHPTMFQEVLDSVHQKALAAGNTDAAVCTDCHGAHDIQPPDEPRSRIPKTCEKCHSQIYNQYKDSVHGAALIGDGNPDVPSCIDCHQVHSIQGPSNSAFRLYSPEICAKCHANDRLMAKYGISTDVFQTYVADFHGTTTTLFQAVTEGQAPNTPVCIDCHGVHDIMAVNNANSPVIKQNILGTCQKCHPDATTSFPNAWLDHYIPSPQHAALVYYVNLFYRTLIPSLIGGMALFVLVDGSRRIVNRRRRRNSENKDE
jgi:hypothetical protein